jgi:hypothetical protein
MQSFVYSIGLKKQFSRFLPPQKSIFFHFWPKSEIDLPVPGRDGGWNISLLGEGKQVQVKSPATEAPSRCYDPPKSRFFPIKNFFLRQGVNSLMGTKTKRVDGTGCGFFWWGGH